MRSVGGRRWLRSINDSNGAFFFDKVVRMSSLERCLRLVALRISRILMTLPSIEPARWVVVVDEYIF